LFVMNPTIAFAGKTALYGVGGWAIENMIFGPRFSAWFNRAPVPFLPVYAAGGAALMLTHLKRVPWILRVPIYSAVSHAASAASAASEVAVTSESRRTR
jgi:hypothetical protein